jgi:hypothetical protein
MKNECAQARVIFQSAFFLAVIAALSGFGVLDPLTGSVDDTPVSVDIVIFIVRAIVIYAIAALLIRRLKRRAAFVCRAPGDDVQPLLSGLGRVLGEFGYRALASSLDTAVADNWKFEAKQINPINGKPVEGSSRVRTATINVAGPGLLRVEGSSALLRHIRKRFPGSVFVTYGSSHPWIRRGLLTLIAMLLPALVYIGYFMPVIECQRHGDRARHVLHSLENRGLGTDIEIQLELSAVEAALGIQKEVNLPGRSEKLGLTLPGGLKNGERLQFRGDGNAGINGAS